MKLFEIIDSEILKLLKEQHDEVVVPDVRRIYEKLISPIGTFEEYLQYTSNIFPNSKVKKIVYRAGLLKLNQHMGGIWFGESEGDVNKFSKEVRGYSNNTIHYCLINLQNPKYYDMGHWHGYIRAVDKLRDDRDRLMDILISEGYDGIIIDRDTWNDGDRKYRVTSEQYVVFNTNQIYSLGVENDINEFQRYLEN